MENLNRPLVPGFLKRLDRKLLLNHPDTWSTRLHLVIWYALLFMLFCGLFAVMYTFDPRVNNNISTGTSFIALLSFVGFIMWMIYLLRFNVFKQYGNLKQFTGLKNLAFFFIGVLFLLLPTYILPVAETYIANKKYTAAELVTDANFINEQLIKIYYPALPKTYNADTVKLSTYILNTNGMYDPQVPKPVEEMREASAQNVGFHYLDSISFKNRMETADSISVISDSMYIAYTAPYVLFVNASNVDAKTSVKSYTNKELFNKFLKGQYNSGVAADTAALRKRLDKYIVPASYYYNYQNRPNTDYLLAVNADYNINAAQQGIGNIIDKKFRWELRGESNIRFILYFTMALSLLIFIYRHTTRKAFFLSILTFIIITVLTGIVTSILHISASNSILTIMLLYYAAFLGIALSIFGAHIRKTWQGIGLNLATFFTFLVPVVLFQIYVESVTPKIYPLPAGMDNARYMYQEQQRMIAEIIGFILIFVLIEPLFKRLYRKWYALPED